MTNKTILTLLFNINNTKHLNNYVATIQNLSITPNVLQNLHIRLPTPYDIASICRHNSP